MKNYETSTYAQRLFVSLPPVNPLLLCRTADITKARKETERRIGDNLDKTMLYTTHCVSFEVHVGHAKYLDADEPGNVYVSIVPDYLFIHRGTQGGVKRLFMLLLLHECFTPLGLHDHFTDQKICLANPVFYFDTIEEQCCDLKEIFRENDSPEIAAKKLVEVIETLLHAVSERTYREKFTRAISESLGKSKTFKQVENDLGYTEKIISRLHAKSIVSDIWLKANRAVREKTSRQLI